MIESGLLMKAFLTALFEKLDVAGVASIAKMPSGENLAYTLFTCKSEIEACVPLFPVMPVNAARAVSKMTRENGPSKMVAVFVRPCELRALKELVKIKQASLDNILTISYDCLGVFPFQEINLADELKLSAYWQSALEGKNCDGIRPVCAACTGYMPKGADISISLIGRDPDQPLLLSFSSEKGRAAAEKMGLNVLETVVPSSAMEGLEQERQQMATEQRMTMEASLSKELGLVDALDRCISCRACRTVCPICYCKNCYFDSETFEYYPESYFKRMAAKGAIRLPLDKVLFHLGRLSHMGASCVACGMCEDVCPVNIPISRIFKTIGGKVQTLFGYMPGENANDPMPLTTYSEAELEAFED